MKVKTVIACAAAAALPLGAAWATVPTGPQGNNWYGPAIGATAERPYDPRDSASAAAGGTRAERRDDAMRGDAAMAERMRDEREPWYRRLQKSWVYQGPSADTNPPVPPP